MLLNVKPALGFTLPSAGVTLHPAIRNREMSRTTFRSQIRGGGGVCNYPHSPRPYRMTLPLCDLKARTSRAT